MYYHLIAGYGEVGQALAAVLSRDTSAVDVFDIKSRGEETGLKFFSAGYDAVHVCFPYGERFQNACEVLMAILRSPGKPLLVVHSTVPLGTTTRLQSALPDVDVVHSPVRGKHPDLRAGIYTFPKCIGGPAAQRAADLFKAVGLTVRCYEQPETTEAIKLWDTTQYGWQIVLAKEIGRWCREHALDFEDVYATANRDYNRGYALLGSPDVQRPVLKDVPGPIGGHCVMPNCDLLDTWDQETWTQGPEIVRVIKRFNADYQHQANKKVE